MKKLIYTFALVLIVHCTLNIEKCFSQWTTVNLGTTNKLSAVSMPERTSSIVWIVGENSSTGAPFLYKSTNSGVNFTTVTTFPSGFIAPRYMRLWDTNSTIIGGYPGLINTSNGGVNWTYLYNSSGIDTSMFVSISFGVNGSVWAVGNVVVGQSFSVPIVIREATTTFKRLTLPGSWSTYRLSSVWAKDSNNCVISTVTSSPGVILKTTNGGINWTNYSIAMETWCLIGDDVNNDIIAVGQSSGASTIFKSTDFGSTWINVYTNAGTGVLYATGEEFIRDTMYAVGQNGMVARSVNGGTTWARQTTGIANNLNCVYNGHHQQIFAIAVGENGTVIRTTNSGVWVQNISTEMPLAFSLSQNYPNPFNPSTSIRYELPKNGFVRLVVYDALGREVETLINEKQSPGTYEVNWDATVYPSGVYFYKLTTEGFSETKKMMLLK